MKRILLILTLFGLLVLPVVGLAQEPAPESVSEDLEVMDVLSNIVDWLFSILLVFAAIMIVIAAYMFVTAAGNPETVTKARHFVVYALVGVAIALASRGLVALVSKIVGTGT